MRFCPGVTCSRDYLTPVAPPFLSLAPMRLSPTAYRPLWLIVPYPISWLDRLGHFQTPYGLLSPTAYHPLRLLIPYGLISPATSHPLRDYLRHSLNETLKLKEILPETATGMHLLQGAVTKILWDKYDELYTRTTWRRILFNDATVITV